MNEFMKYLIQVIAASGVLYLFYFLFLKNNTYFKLNRYYLLISLILPPILPFINIPVSPQETIYSLSIILDEIIVTSGGEVIQANPKTVNYSILFYSIIAAIFILRIIWATISIYIISRKSGKDKIGEYIIVSTTDKINPFSVFKYIFVSKSHFDDREGLEQIISHEAVHIKQLHSIDNFIAEIICSVFWINPFVWITKDNLKSTHEYLADEKVMEQGFDTAGYFKLLFENVVGKRFGLANNFNESLTLKRMKMMKKKRSPRYLRWLYLMALPLIGVIIFTISCTEKQTKTEQVDKETQKKIVEAEEKTYQYMEADVEPQFPGGQKEFMNYIINEINYPEQSKLDGIEGRVFIKFIISKTGEIINASVASSVNETLDAEALRVVSGMPKWTPGEIEGQPVNVEFVVPIHFKLE
jgi:TonB family protein